MLEQNKTNLTLTVTLTLNLLLSSIVFHNKICVFIITFMVLSFLWLFTAYFLYEEVMSVKVHVKLWWVGACERKKRAFLVPLILSEGIFLTFVFHLNILCIEYTFRIYILLHIKNHYFMHLFACFWNHQKPSVHP